MNTYDDEATQYMNAPKSASMAEEQPSPRQSACNVSGRSAKSEGKNDTVRQVAYGAGGGLLIGGLATVLMGMKGADAPDAPVETGKDGLSHPEWVDDKVPVAASVGDDMSFGEAFAAARAEVGPGGTFEWHGQLYGTYTAEEWDNMSAGQRAEFAGHFSWNHIDSSSSQVMTAEQAPYIQADPEVVSVDSADVDIDAHALEPDYTDELVADAGIIDAVPDSEIEILGVAHNAESDMNVGGVNIDGQDVILIDVDNDLKFDYMVEDLDGDGHISQDEMIDISGHNLTVDDLGGMPDSLDSDLYASGDAPDYSVDGIYEG